MALTMGKEDVAKDAFDILVDKNCDELPSSVGKEEV